MAGFGKTFHTGLTPPQAALMSPTEGSGRTPPGSRTAYHHPDGNPVAGRVPPPPPAAAAGAPPPKAGFTGAGLGALDFDLGGAASIYANAHNQRLHTPPDSLAPPMSEVPQEEQIRRLLVAFFICYAPERLIEVPEKMKELVEGGTTPEHVLEMLRRDWGSCPIEGEILAVLQRSFITRLYCYFARYNPSMFRNVPYLAHKYRNAQAELMVNLEIKYAPDADPMKLFCAEEQRAKEAADKMFDELQDSDDDELGDLGGGGGGVGDDLRGQGTVNMTEASFGNFGSKDVGEASRRGADDSPASRNNTTAASSSSPMRGGGGGNDLDDLDDDDDERMMGSTMRAGGAAGAGAGGGSGFKASAVGSGASGSPFGASGVEVSYMFDKLGIDRSKLRAPLPRYQDPGGAKSGVKTMTKEDMDLL